MAALSMVGTGRLGTPPMGDQSNRTRGGEVMVQVACEQIHLGSAPQLEQLENHSLRKTPLCGVGATAGQEVSQLAVGTWPVYRPDCA